MIKGESSEIIVKWWSGNARELVTEFCWKLHVAFVASEENNAYVLTGEEKTSLKDVECGDCSLSLRGLKVAPHALCECKGEPVPSLVGGI